MASEDDDIGLSLPELPPSAPARRDAAIQKAMRRFDGKSDAPRVASAQPAPERSDPWWRRPQLGALVAASLIVVMGLPLAWFTVNQTSGPATEPASRDLADLKTFDVEEDASRAASPATPKVPAIASEPPSALAARDSRPAIEAAALPEKAFARGTSVTTPALAVSEAKRADNAFDARGQTALAQTRIAPPPPPAMTVQEAPAAAKPRQGLAAADSNDSVIVTGARRRGRFAPDRGDWNACTINDPKRSLVACKSLVNPGEKGGKGQAAAHLADGLTLAWQGSIDRAIAAFDRALAIAPKSSLAHLNRGLAYQRQGDVDRALADFDQAVRLSPSAARGYYNRSQLLRERGEARRANADQARAVSLDSDYEAVVD